MKKLYLSSLICIFTFSLMGQNRWSWGAELQVGQAGERIHTQHAYNQSSIGYGNSQNNSIFAPSFAAGLWADYQLGIRWSLQSGLRFRQLNHHSREKSFRYSTTDQLISYYYALRTLRQQSVELPLQLRYHFALPTRKLRPYLGITIASAYLLSGEQQTVNTSYNAARGQTNITTQRYELDFSAAYVETSPWQVTYGAEIGLIWREFTLSITQNRTFRADRKDYNSYPYICCFGDCALLPSSDYYNLYSQTRILRNANLRLQYQF